MANLHARSTQNRIADLIDRAETTLDSSGLCVAGGAGAEDVEPDASKYICDSCGKPAVYGVKLIAIMAT